MTGRHEMPTEGKTTAKRCGVWIMLAFPAKDKLLFTYTQLMENLQQRMLEPYHSTFLVPYTL